MHNLAAVFDPRIKLSGVHILLDEIGRYMNEDSEESKAEVTTLLNDIFTIYDEKIRGSRIPTFSQPESSSSRRSSVFSFIAHRRHTTHASSSSSSSSSPLSSELEFYLRNDLQSALDETQIENLDVLGWWKSVKNQYPSCLPSLGIS